MWKSCIKERVEARPRLTWSSQLECIPTPSSTSTLWKLSCINCHSIPLNTREQFSVSFSGSNRENQFLTDKHTWVNWFYSERVCCLTRPVIILSVSLQNYGGHIDWFCFQFYSLFLLLQTCWLCWSSFGSKPMTFKADFVASSSFMNFGYVVLEEVSVPSEPLLSSVFSKCRVRHCQWQRIHAD